MSEQPQSTHEAAKHLINRELAKLAHSKEELEQRVAGLLSDLEEAKADLISNQKRQDQLLATLKELA